MSIKINSLIIDVPQKARVLLFVENDEVKCYEILRDNYYVQTIHGFLEIVHSASSQVNDE